jgi:hypothetical protein
MWASCVGEGAARRDSCRKAGDTTGPNEMSHAWQSAEVKGASHTTRSAKTSRSRKKR